MIKNRAFAVNIFLPQVVEHENADFMNGFRISERSSQGVEHGNAKNIRFFRK